MRPKCAIAGSLECWQFAGVVAGTLVATQGAAAECNVFSFRLWTRQNTGAGHLGYADEEYLYSNIKNLRRLSIFSVFKYQQANIFNTLGLHLLWNVTTITFFHELKGFNILFQQTQNCWRFLESERRSFRQKPLSSSSLKASAKLGSHHHQTKLGWQGG